MAVRSVRGAGIANAIAVYTTSLTIAIVGKNKIDPAGDSEIRDRPGRISVPRQIDE